MNGKKILCAGLVVLVVFLGGPLAKESRADFTLWDDEQLTVDTLVGSGILYDESYVKVVSSGRVGGMLFAYNRSSVDIYGGRVCRLRTYNSSTVNLFGGDLNADFQAFDTSRVYISGGTAHGLYAFNSTIVNISGGEVKWLRAYETSTATFIARDFRLGEGLSLEGDRVLGTGFLSGEWYDGTRWTVSISANDSGATILAIPEPATLSLLALGGLAFILRKRNR